MRKGWAIWGVIACLCVALLSGCRGEHDKGSNRGLDRPKPVKT